MNSEIVNFNKITLKSISFLKLLASGYSFRIDFAYFLNVRLLKKAVMSFLYVTCHITLVFAFVTAVRTPQIGLFATLNVHMPQEVVLVGVNLGALRARVDSR